MPRIVPLSTLFCGAITLYLMLFVDSGSKTVFACSLNAYGETFLQETMRDRLADWRHLDMSIINAVAVGGILGLPLDGKVLHETVEYMNDAGAALSRSIDESVFYGGFHKAWSGSIPFIGSWRAASACRKNRRISFPSSIRGNLNSAGWERHEEIGGYSAFGRRYPSGRKPFIFFRSVKPKALWSHLSATPPWIIAAVFALTMLTLWLRSIRWGLILPPLKGDHLRLFGLLMIGFMVNNFLPARLGEVTRVSFYGNATVLPSRRAPGP